MSCYAMSAVSNSADVDFNLLANLHERSLLCEVKYLSALQP
jgi:hypothetical protein